MSDANKRSQYDRFGHAGVNRQGFGDHFHTAEDVFSAFGDIFGDFSGFSTGGRRRPRQCGLRYNLKVSFRDAAKAQSRLNIPKKKSALIARVGFGPGRDAETCRHCGGQGRS